MGALYNETVQEGIFGRLTEKWLTHKHCREIDRSLGLMLLIVSRPQIDYS